MAWCVGAVASCRSPGLEDARSPGPLTHTPQVELRRSDRDDRVLELTLRNERSRNSLTGRMMMQLHDIAVELASPASQHRDCCALILRGEGSTFCSGADFHLASKISSPAQGVLMANLMTSTLTCLRYAWGRRHLLVSPSPLTTHHNNTTTAARRSSPWPALGTRWEEEQS